MYRASIQCVEVFLKKMLRYLLLFALVFSSVLNKSLRGSEDEPEDVVDDLLHLTLLHVNDIHSHFEEVNVNTGTCKEEMKRRGESVSYTHLTLPTILLV